MRSKKIISGSLTPQAGDLLPEEDEGNVHTCVRQASPPELEGLLRADLRLWFGLFGLRLRSGWFRGQRRGCRGRERRFGRREWGFGWRKRGWGPPWLGLGWPLPVQLLRGRTRWVLLLIHCMGFLPPPAPEFGAKKTQFRHQTDVSPPKNFFF